MCLKASFTSPQRWHSKIHTHTLLLILCWHTPNLILFYCCLYQAKGKNLFRFIVCIPYINLKVLPKGNQQADIVAFNTCKLELLAGSTTEKNFMMGNIFFSLQQVKNQLHNIKAEYIFNNTQIRLLMELVRNHSRSLNCIYSRDTMYLESKPAVPQF